MCADTQVSHDAFKFNQRKLSRLRTPLWHGKEVILTHAGSLDTMNLIEDHFRQQLPTKPVPESVEPLFQETLDFVVSKSQENEKHQTLCAFYNKRGTHLLKSWGNNISPVPVLGGHPKSGQWWSPQNRPTENKSGQR